MKTPPKLLKIHSMYTGSLNADRSAKVIPKIVLSGDWLNNAGFKAGDSIIILVEPQRIVIERLAE